MDIKLSGEEISYLHKYMIQNPNDKVLEYMKQSLEYQNKIALKDKQILDEREKHEIALIKEREKSQKARDEHAELQGRVDANIRTIAQLKEQAAGHAKPGCIKFEHLKELLTACLSSNKTDSLVAVRDLTGLELTETRKLLETIPAWKKLKDD